MENAKHILFVITQGEWGGAQSYVLKCASEAVRRGYRVHIAAGSSGELEKCCVEQTIPFILLKSLKRNLSFVSDIRAVRELKALFQTLKPDIVYLHSSKAGVVGSIAAKRAKVPKTVYRIGGWSFLDPVSPLQRFIRRWSEKLTARFKDAVIVLHPGDEALAKRHGMLPQGELTVIPNGLDLDAFERRLLDRASAHDRLVVEFTKGIPAPDSRLPTPDSPIILTIANFYATKDLARYMDAIPCVHKKMPRARVLIIGEGKLRNAIESKRKKLELEEVVSLPGSLESASTLLRGADLFVLPSAKEGMPWTLLEAMAAGIPCVATDVGANKWMLGGNGLVVPPNDPNALANAILNALRDAASAKQRAERARQSIRDRFTERAMWEKTFEVLS